MNASFYFLLCDPLPLCGKSEFRIPLAKPTGVWHINALLSLAVKIGKPVPLGSAFGATMGKWSKWLGALLLATGFGCQNSGPFQAPPGFAVPWGAEANGAKGTVIYHDDQNPVYIPLGPESYGHVFESCLRVLIDYQLEIQESNRYDGRIECVPRIAPGIGLFMKPGSPDPYERLLATAQTYRHRVSLAIQPATNGGFFIEVAVRKELEDLARPIRSTVGSAIFRTENNVERQFEVVDPAFFDTGWIYKGRDAAMEQEIIRRLKQCM